MAIQLEQISKELSHIVTRHPRITIFAGVGVGVAAFFYFGASKIPVVEIVQRELSSKIRHLIKGTNREEEYLKYVFTNSKEGNAEEVMNAIDKYGWEQDWMMNVGDVKGELLDQLMKERKPKVRFIDEFSNLIFF
jgi:hypothetical protein